MNRRVPVVWPHCSRPLSDVFLVQLKPLEELLQALVLVQRRGTRSGLDHPRLEELDVRTSHHTDKAPAELRPALTGSRPWKRLAAFVQLPRHSSLRATADALGLHHKTLTKYIQRLERELDQQLLNRAPAAPYSYTTLTSEGLALVETVTAFLERTSRTSRATLTRLPASVAFSRRPRRDRAQR